MKGRKKAETRWSNKFFLAPPPMNARANLLRGGGLNKFVWLPLHSFLTKGLKISNMANVLYLELGN